MGDTKKLKVKIYKEQYLRRRCLHELRTWVNGMAVDRPCVILLKGHTQHKTHMGDLWV